VTSASAAGSLLIRKINRPVRRSSAGSFKRIRVGRIGDRQKVQLACEDGVRKFGLKRRQIEHRARHPALMLMAILAALAECVSAPTLMKSTPVSA